VRVYLEAATPDALAKLKKQVLDEVKKLTR